MKDILIGEFIDKFVGSFPDVHARKRWKTWDELREDMRKDLIKIAAAPTVATDNSGEMPAFKKFTMYDDTQRSVATSGTTPVASPVEEEQEELWMQVAVDCHGITIKGVSKVIKELSDKFIITRKS